uniref:Uncharacterized protein n=1 Tax=Anguilla anguilla TaxID=7936 RepID=A0A0E9WT27_ANGAN
MSRLTSPSSDLNCRFSARKGVQPSDACG